MENCKFVSWLITLITLPLAMAVVLPTLVYAQNTPSKGVAPSVDTGSHLPLAEYLKQVKKGNRSHVGSEARVEGARLRGGEASLLTKPALIGSTEYFDDRRETGSPLQGDRLEISSTMLGVRQQTSFGLEGRVVYKITQTSLPHANPAFVPLLKYYTTGPALELTQSLGRNWLGAETKAQKDLVDADIKSTEFNEKFNQQQILANAESAYWRLAVAREAVQATQETVDRAKRLKKWSSDRTRLNLADRSDYLQTESAFLGRSLELQAAIDAEKAAARTFNTLRGLNSDLVTEELSSLDDSVMESLKPPEKLIYRDDVKAAEQLKRLAQASAQLNREKNKPDVKLYGSYGLNGRDVYQEEAMKEAGTDKQPYYTIGIRVDIPLDIGTQSDVRKGYQKNAMAADLQYQQKVFEQERLWQDIRSRFQESLNHYRLAKNIEKANREKMEYERNRHRRGLTTTFQVLQFEQDFSTAQLTRLQIQGEVLNIHAQLKTFGGNQ